MLTRTHLAITIFGILVLLSYVEYKTWFVVAALVATYVPDIDCSNSKLGHKWYFKPLQFFIKHRGMVHSFSFLILLTLFIALFFPVVALGFFLGYGLHLLADSFTVQGITPFYPSKKKTSGEVTTGGLVETGIFVFFILADLLVLIIHFF